MGEDRKIFQQCVAQFDGPAFVRRAREVQFAFDTLVEACCRKREEWLPFVRVPLGMLFALAGTAMSLEAFLGSGKQLETLKTLRQALEPRLRLPPAPTSSGRVLGRALAELRGAIERFNGRWQVFIAGLDLQNVNDLRDRYNRYYLLEKECALGSSRLARQGFQRLNPLKPADLLENMPLLPMP